jgi:D-alanyl-D-alanine endopeptidase (penicillin-binding protein 7)
MTAVVFLENSPDLTQTVVVQRADVRNASTTYIRAGYKLTTADLLHLTLIASDNAAARVLARVSPHGATGFIARMNEKAAELGLTTTHYADPSGLLSANVSSAYDMARLIAYVGEDQRIAGIMRKANHSIGVGPRTINIHSTNQLVMKGDVDVLGGKTGFIRAAGYCLATLLRLPQGGPQVAVVVIERRPVLGNAAPVQLAGGEGAGSLRDAGSGRDGYELSLDENPDSPDATIYRRLPTSYPE